MSYDRPLRVIMTARRRCAACYCLRLYYHPTNFGYTISPENDNSAMFPVQGNRFPDEKWKCAYELFERAVKLPASERFAFVESATSDPEVLRLALELIEN